MRACDRPGPGSSRVTDLLVFTGYGDRDAFHRLFDATAGVVLGVIRRTTPDPAAAEQLCEDAYVEIWRQAARFDPAETSAVSWVLGIVRERAARG